MKIFFSALCLILAPAFLWAQDGKVSITGTIMDGDTRQAMEFATVSLLHPDDSSLVAGGMTDANGRFEIMAKPGSYIVKAQFVSYASTTQAITVPDNTSNLEVGTITISENSETLSEVTVEGEKLEMEMKLDKRVFNVGENLSNIGSNASEILDNLPSVSVDMEGNVSLRGSQNVKILVNGKPSGLVGISGTEALRQFQGNMIESVEVITNPSARYDAEGMAGIINIILKKDKRKGFNGSVTTKVGYPQQYGVSGNLNYRRKWLNLFTNYGIEYRESIGRGNTYQRFTNPDSAYYTNIDRTTDRSDFSNNIQLGADIYLNDYNIITGSFLYRISDEQNNGTVNYHDYNLNSNQLIARSSRYNHEKEDEELLEYSLNYTKTFPDHDDHKLTFDLQYRDNNEIEDADIEEYTREGEEASEAPLLQGYYNQEIETNYLVQADYIHPFGENAKFETGYRGTLRDITNPYYVEEQNDAGQWVRLSEFSNDFSYDEDIHALYAIYGNEMRKFSYQVGVRTEYTKIRTYLAQTNESNPRDYLNFFPSVHLTYKIVNDNSIQLSYSRRFDRPSFWDLNPFFNYTDNRNIRSGNPNLDPEFTDAYELGYMSNWQKGSLYAGFYYRYSTGIIERINTVEEGVTQSVPQNLNTRNAYGIELTGDYDLMDWWKVNGNINFYRQLTEGQANGQDLSSDALTLSARANSKLTIMDKWNIQFNGFFRAPEQTTQGRRLAMFSLNAGISRDILNNNGTLTFNVSDVFNSRKYRAITRGDNFYTESEFQWRPRQFMLTFDYRINKRKGRGQQSHGDGGDDGGF